MKHLPLVSIIIPIYKCEKYIECTINSIIKQTYQNWELICVDDCSPDSSVEIIERIAKNDSRIRLVRQKQNSGPAATRNLGLEYAKGEYISFLDSDDLWSKEKLDIQVRMMMENGWLFSFTAYNLIDVNGNDLGVAVHVPKRMSYHELLKNTRISTITVMAKKSLKEQLKMPVQYKNGEDMAAWLNVLKVVDYAYGIDIVLSSYRQVENSLSSGFFNKITRMWKVYREIEKLSLLQSMYYYCIYFVNLIRKRRKNRG